MNWPEREIERHIVKNFLAKYWGTIAAIGLPLIQFLLPSLTTYETHNPKTALGVAIGVLLSLYHARAPKDKP